MLAIPTKGISRSTEKHNVDLDVLCDWMEGSVLFQDDTELPASDVIDVLCEGEIYDNQDFAWEIVLDAWSELHRREQWLGAGYPIEITNHHLKRRGDWRDTPAHSFCLALAFAKCYPDWARPFGRNFAEQGELFESLTKESLQALFSGWEIHSTGWTRTSANKLTAVVSKVASLLGESMGKISRWTRPKANDAGLDLLCYRPFPDGRVGVPVYLFQCASGGDWEGKLHTPNLQVWTKIIEFASRPKKAFATPFAFRDDEFVTNCNLVDGLLMDRYRLLTPARENPNWVPEALKGRLVAWLAPRIQQLPKANQ
jgi:hypothetical protein